jgi:hypothetical protein
MVSLRLLLDLADGKIKRRDASFLVEEAPRPGDTCLTGRNYKRMGLHVKE